MGSKKLKVSILLSAILCLCIGHTALASEGVSTKRLQKPHWSSEIRPMQMFGTYLTSGGCGVTEIDTGEVSFEGETSCHRVAEKVVVKIYLECLDEENDSWYTVDIKKATARDTNYLSAWKDVDVERDRYYRARGFHSAEAELGAVYETQSSFSSRIFLD